MGATEGDIEDDGTNEESLDGCNDISMLGNELGLLD